MASAWVVKSCVSCKREMPIDGFPKRSHVCHACSAKPPVCTLCGQLLTSANRRVSGLQCRPCHNARTRRWYLAKRPPRESHPRGRTLAATTVRAISTSSALRFSITEASLRSGVTKSEIRIWELRHHWPVPDRLANGYRVYTLAHIEQLSHAKAMRDAGYRIGALIQDGVYVGRELQSAQCPVKESKPMLILPPENRDQIGAELEMALERKVLSIIARELASLGIYPPARRQAIVRSVEAADRFHGGCFRQLLDRYAPSPTTRSA